jgi:hypothetical protein
MEGRTKPSLTERFSFVRVFQFSGFCKLDRHLYLLLSTEFVFSYIFCPLPSFLMGVLSSLLSFLFLLFFSLVSGLLHSDDSDDSYQLRKWLSLDVVFDSGSFRGGFTASFAVVVPSSLLSSCSIEGWLSFSFFIHRHTHHF